jgi:HTH-type transcriptional regulator/antitoxin HigA
MLLHFVKHFLCQIKLKLFRLFNQSYILVGTYKQYDTIIPSRNSKSTSNSSKPNKDYNKTLKTIEHVMDAKPGMPQMDELKVLTTLVEACEKQHDKIEASDQIKAIKFRMKQEGLKQKDLAAIVKSKSRVSQILNRKRKLTLEMIRNLHQALHIPIESLFTDYKIGRA